MVYDVAVEFGADVIVIESLISRVMDGKDALTIFLSC